MLRWFTIFLSVIGLAVAVYAVAQANEAPLQIPLARPASINPYAQGVAALGIVEPSGRDVGVVSPENALITKVHADVGDRVKMGQPLFELDTRLLQADLLRAEAAVAIAQAEIDRWHALPRVEDQPPLQASVVQARAILDDREEQFRLTEEAAKRQANNQRDVSIARFARDSAAAQLARTQADLAKLMAGGWQADLTIFTSQLDARNAEVQALRVLMDRMIVRAPRDGQILRRNIEVGEYATAGAQSPAMILGDLAHLRIRTQVDEEDIALVSGVVAQLMSEASANSPANTLVSLPPRALARRRGGVPTEFPLRLVRIEPFARAKSDLTGSNIERVDTRVVEVLFDVLPAQDGQPGTAVPLVPGQAVDVFIDTGT